MGLQGGAGCWLDLKSSFYRCLHRAARACSPTAGDRKWELLISSWVWNLSRHYFCMLSDLRVGEPTIFIEESFVSLSEDFDPLSYQL